MKADTSWDAPDATRLKRARIAWETHATGVWGRASSLDAKPSWVQELWAQVADAALDGQDADEGARLAYAKRVELEDRARLGESWDTLPSIGHQVWLQVATSVRQVSL